VPARESPNGRGTSLVNVSAGLDPSRFLLDTDETRRSRQPQWRRRKVVVPNCVGLDYLEAVHLLNRIGVRYEIHRMVDPPEPVMGRVVDQQPAGGLRVRRKRTHVQLWLVHKHAGPGGQSPISAGP